jgi:hypothetical protein
MGRKPALGLVLIAGLASFTGCADDKNTRYTNGSTFPSNQSMAGNTTTGQQNWRQANGGQTGGGQTSGAFTPDLNRTANNGGQGQSTAGMQQTITGSSTFTGSGPSSNQPSNGGTSTSGIYSPNTSMNSSASQPVTTPSDNVYYTVNGSGRTTTSTGMTMPATGPSRTGSSQPNFDDVVSPTPPSLPAGATNSTTSSSRFENTGGTGSSNITMPPNPPSQPLYPPPAPPTMRDPGQ